MCSTIRRYARLMIHNQLAEPLRAPLDRMHPDEAKGPPPAGGPGVKCSLTPSDSLNQQTRISGSL
jgi:hypothetical protein